MVQTSRQQVFRQRTPLALAAVCVVIGVGLLVSLVADWADRPQPLYLAWVLFGLALTWSLFVRPSVRLDDQGVTVRNVVRDIRIPWAELTDVESRWNLRLLVGDRGYTAWAISSQVERPKGATRGLIGGFLPGRVDGYGGARAHPSAPAPKVTASMVARSIEAAREAYGRAVAQGEVPAQPRGGVRVTWVPLSLLILSLPAIALVALSLT